MINVIKQAAVQAVNSTNPVQLVEAEVVTSFPDIKIRLDNNKKLVIPKELIIVPEHLTQHKKNVVINDEAANRNVELTYKDELKAGDKVMAIRFQGGQQFFIIDKIITY